MADATTTAPSTGVGRIDIPNDPVLYAQMRRVAEIAHECLHGVPDILFALLNSGRGQLNSYWDYSQAGLFVEFFYSNSLPTQMWTPWGRWSFVGSCSYQVSQQLDDQVTEFLRRCGCELYLEEPYDYNNVSKIYGIYSIDGVPTPKPVPPPSNRFLGMPIEWHQEVQRVFDKLADGYVPTQPS